MSEYDAPAVVVPDAVSAPTVEELLLASQQFLTETDVALDQTETRWAVTTTHRIRNPRGGTWMNDGILILIIGSFRHCIHLGLNHGLGGYHRGRDVRDFLGLHGIGDDDLDHDSSLFGHVLSASTSVVASS
ncbi:uncharacterized protein IUM83_13614 [Phytophthora cinnamomi]|uniref:uncharacterized protein n=1 Tax=Phytophthora cinnamomi TaxID=4785 RepID=UPI00355A0D56|nr:hypothetical protein IUM83_13614 [Phytophthora cinnamomi]